MNSRPSNNGGPQNAANQYNNQRAPLPPLPHGDNNGYRRDDSDDDDDMENPASPYAYFDLPLLNVSKNIDIIPERIRPLILMAKTDAMKDALFLTTMALLPFTICRQLRFRYNKTDYHAATILIFCAPPASGKGLIGELFHLLDIEDDRRRKIYAEDMKRYKQSLEARNMAGKNRAEMEIPEKPKLFAAKIAADNSAPGMLENIHDAGGTAALLATEINELAESTQRKGCGDPTTILCKTWGHEDLFMNRRTDQLNLLVKSPIVPGTLTGTPSQLKALIRTPGNGFFTRAVYYHIPIMKDWLPVVIDTVESINSDDDTPKTSNKELVLNFSKEWEALLHKRFDNVSDIRMVLTNKQLCDFNERMDALTARAGDNGLDMVSLVHRLGSNVLRLTMSLALLRALDPAYSEFKLLSPRRGSNPDNIKDGITPLMDLRLLDKDYHFMMNMIEPLYSHSMQTLSILDKDPTVSNHAADREVLWNDLPDEFTYEMAYSLGRSYTPEIKERTIRSWVSAYIEEGALTKVKKSFFIKNQALDDVKKNLSNK